MHKLSVLEELEYLIESKELELQLRKDNLVTEIQRFGESLSPINLIKEKIKSVVKDSKSVSGIVNTALGYFSGFLAKKMFVGKSESTFVDIEGTILQMLVANKVSANADELKELARTIIKAFISKDVTDENA
jgi:hypothetical protein